MAIAAQLFRDDRGAERHSVGFDATLRDPDRMPLDVVVEDLSSTGFRVLTSADLAPNAEIGLGLAGIGMQRARVIWRAGNSYGCEFLTPLKGDDLRAALSAPSSEPVALRPADDRGAGIAASATPGARQGLSPRARLFAIIASAIAAWAVAVAVGVIVMRVIELVWPA